MSGAPFYYRIAHWHVITVVRIDSAVVRPLEIICFLVKTTLLTNCSEDDLRSPNVSGLGTAFGMNRFVHPRQAANPIWQARKWLAREVVDLVRNKVLP